MITLPPQYRADPKTLQEARAERVALIKQCGSIYSNGDDEYNRIAYLTGCIIGMEREQAVTEALLKQQDQEQQAPEPRRSIYGPWESSQDQATDTPPSAPEAP